MKKTFLKRVLSVFIAIVTILSLCAVNTYAEKIALIKSSVTIVKGVSYTLKVSGTSAAVKWSTEDKSVATVTSKGKVTAVGLGSTEITAKVGSTTLECEIKVIAGTIKFEKTEAWVGVDKTAKVYAAVKGSKSVGYSISNTKVATVSFGEWDGETVSLKIKGIKEGAATVKLYLMDDRSIAKNIKITVKNGVEDAVIEDENEAVDDMSYAEQVLYYVNIEREKAGVEPLKLNDELNKAAEIRAEEIVDLFSHTRPDDTSCDTVFDEIDYEPYWNGENIAAGLKTAKQTVSQWMASKGHRENILRPEFTELGAAMVYDKNGKYKYYWVQVFGSQK